MSFVIAIDGTDASGKKTQTDILEAHLKENGYKVVKLSFPDYDSPSSTLVKMYLDGQFGTDPADVNAYAASSFFAVDRYASFKKNWEKDYKEENCVILLNRYTTSNAVHQLSKIEDDGEKERFLAWLWDFEFVKLGLPVPDLVLYLEMPTDISIRLLNRRCEDTGAKKDIHESDPTHLEKSHKAALFACAAWGWERIFCAKDGEPLKIEEIAETVREKVGLAMKEKGFTI